MLLTLLLCYSCSVTQLWFWLWQSCSGTRICHPLPWLKRGPSGSGTPLVPLGTSALHCPSCIKHFAALSGPGTRGTECWAKAICSLAPSNKYQISQWLEEIVGNWSSWNRQLGTWNHLKVNGSQSSPALCMAFLPVLVFAETFIAHPKQFPPVPVWAVLGFYKLCEEMLFVYRE